MLVLQINNGIDYSLNPAESDPRGVYLRQWDQRLILNSILSLVTIGCQWRMLPRTFHFGKLFIAMQMVLRRKVVSASRALHQRT
ncbi:TPA: transposase [Candidatus Poribacteria bacterium]|nr:transposase [Candidatus Poribacteria bacterium]